MFNRDYLNGRTYEFFLEFITNNPYCDVVEMDTVEGCNKESYILTLLFRSSNYMMAFKLKDHTSQSVIDIFDDIKQKIGIDVFKTIFPIILTDRGSEFSSPEDIEIDKTLVKCYLKFSTAILDKVNKKAKLKRITLN